MIPEPRARGPCRTLRIAFPTVAREMEPEQTTGLTYEALRQMPEDGLRREIIGGDLHVTAAPSTRHQDVVFGIEARLRRHAEAVGGRTFAGVGLLLSADEFPVPDVLFVGPQRVSQVEANFVRDAPDLVVEVSSPSTRRTDLVRKKGLYERFGVPEYWFVDLDADRLEVYRLEGGTYGQPMVVGRGRMLESPLLPGFSAPVDELLGEPQ